MQHDCILNFDPTGCFHVSFSGLSKCLCSGFFSGSIPVSRAGSIVRGETIRFSFVSLPRGIYSILTRVS